MSLVVRNINFLEFLNKYLYDKKLIFILGFLTPLPIFINFENLSLMLIKFEPIIAYTGTNTDIPIPIGFIASSIFIFLLIKKTNKLIEFIKILVFLFCIFVSHLLYFLLAFGK